MRLDNIYEKVACDNAGLLGNLTYYICATNKVLESELKEMSITALKNEIKKILKHVRYASVDVHILESQIQKEALMIECFRRSFYISGENYDSVGAGRNNGLIRNNIEEMHIKNLEREQEMLQEQMKRYAKRDSLKKSLEQNSKMINEVIEIIPNDLYRKIVYDFYINDIQTMQLSKMYNISYDYVGKAQARGLDSLAKIYKNYLNFNN